MSNQKEYHRLWAIKNKKRRSEWGKIYREKNKEKISLRKKIYRQKNREKTRQQGLVYYYNLSPLAREKRRMYRREYTRKKLKEDLIFHLNSRMRGSIGEILRGKKNKTKWTILAGYTAKELKKHLENQFAPEMDWNNWGSYWHIDHIKPISLFHFVLPEDKEFKECWALNNLRPLEKIANQKKYNHYSG